MTLEEYVNQKDPIRHPKVILQRCEIHMGYAINIGGRKLISIWIVDGCAKDMGIWGIMYVKWEDSNCLMTTDKDGNPKNYSCFHLES